ncbi:hypothetical protein EYF80_017649 [Liparis tanakae]|uniref:Uncharacterized protein n=1 Tax=Liparis tanakae TaxID=230148 RepID=A0A4Z2I485_9TELE|nr:hypothetical protein EYF80_017649 [Liparis tanakae]
MTPKTPKDDVYTGPKHGEHQREPTCPEEASRLMVPPGGSPVDSPVDLLEALRLISVTMSRDTWVVNCSRSENFSVMVLGGALPNT